MNNIGSKRPRDESIDFHPLKKAKYISFLETLPLEIWSHIFSYCRYEIGLLSNKKFFVLALKALTPKFHVNYYTFLRYLDPSSNKNILRSIKLKESKLSTHKIAKFKNFTHLKKLDLAFQSTYRSIEFSSLKKLQLNTLSLKFQKYNRKLHLDFINLTSLLKLKIPASNEIQELFPQFIHLTQLQLWQPPLFVKHENLIAGLTQLTQLKKLSLELNHCYSRDLSATALVSLPIHTLKIEDLRCKEYFKVFLNLTQLTSLNLKDNHLENLEWITVLCSLRSLNLDKSFHIPNNLAFEKLSNLTALSINSTNMGEHHFSHIQSLSLISLSIQSCPQLSLEVFNNITQLTSLTSIQLGGNHQLKKGLIILSKLTCLKSLTLCSSQNACFEKIQHLFPNVSIQTRLAPLHHA